MEFCNEMYRKIKIKKNSAKRLKKILKKKQKRLEKKTHLKGLLVSLIFQAPSCIG